MSFFVASFAACLAAATPASPAAQTIPFTIVNGGQIQLPVSFNGNPPVPALFDLGAGLTVLSATEAKKLGIATTGTFTGFRMGGGRVDTPTGGPVAMALSGFQATLPEVGIWDGLDAFGMPALISAEPFRAIPFTLDFVSNTLTLEDAASLAKRAGAGETSDLILADDRDTSLDLFARFDFAPGVSGLCIVDTGSQGVFLNQRFAKTLGVDLNDPKLRHIKYDQGTGVVSTIPELQLQGAAQTRRAKPHAAFVDMIYDCNVGTRFWDRTALTVDIPARKLYVSKR
jgi:hypothetical protein